MEEDQFHGQEPDGERVSREGVERLRALLGGTRVAMLTTMEPGGALRSRPMAVQEIDEEGEAWLITERASAKVEEVEREHHVNLSFLRPMRGRYVSVSGRATVVRDEAKLRQLWHPTLQVWFPDGLDQPDLCLLRVRIDKAETWDAPVGNLQQVARLAGTFLGRAPKAGTDEGRDTFVIRMRQPGIGDTAGILGAAGGNMGVAPRAPKERGGGRVVGAAGGTMGAAPISGRAGAKEAREAPQKEAIAREPRRKETPSRAAKKAGPTAGAEMTGESPMPPRAVTTAAATKPPKAAKSTEPRKRAEGKNDQPAVQAAAPRRGGRGR